MRRDLLAYLSEFRLGWPNLLGACLGLALGSALNHYMINLFGPPLIAEFGWARSEFALVGSLSLFTMIFVPVAGRFVDRFGARTSAIIGFTAMPLAFIAFSMMSGNILVFFAITVVQSIFGILTTSMVFCRVVVERFDNARGMALSIAMSGPPLASALAVPFVGEIIDTQGWRAGYQALAILSAAGGLGAVFLIGINKHLGKDRGSREKKSMTRAQPKRMTLKEFLALVRHPAFLLLVGGMFLVNVPQIIVSSQLKLVLFDNGASNRFATLAISLYAFSVVIGRFICGYALDRAAAHVVAGCVLGLPAVGFLMFLSPLEATWALVIAVSLVGLAQGAEGDVGAYLTSRKFTMKHYSFIYGFLVASMGASSAVGALVLSLTLHLTDSFTLFLMLCAVSTLLGGVCFYLTGRYGNNDEAAVEGELVEEEASVLPVLVTKAP